MPTSQSLKAVPSRPSETRSTSRPSATRRIFDTMENLFFREGDELSNAVPVENDLDEVTELIPRPKSRRKLAIIIGVAAALALVILAVLIF